MRDPYSVLGVKKDAGSDEIKAAWRSIAKSVHPDQNRDDPNATKRFAEIGQAYDVLKDPKKRTRYDERVRMAEAKKKEQTIQQRREEALQAAERAKAARENAAKVMEELARAEAAKTKAQAGKAQAPGATGGETPEDMVSRIFGAQQSPQPNPTGPTAASSSAKPASTDNRAQPEPAEDASRTVEAEAAARSGTSLPAKTVDLLASLVRRIRGIQPLPEKAPDIPATVTVTVDDLLRESWIPVPLPEGKEARFQLEPGAADGDVIRLKNQGLKLQNMQRGDVVVLLRVDQSGPFKVQDSDIHTILPVNLQNAVLGCNAIADSPSGPVEVTVPAWSGSDQTIRVAGGGLPKASGGHGDLVVEIRLMLWEKPDEKVTDLMRSMREGLFL